MRNSAFCSPHLPIPLKPIRTHRPACNLSLSPYLARNDRRPGIEAMLTTITTAVFPVALRTLRASFLPSLRLQHTHPNVDPSQHQPSHATAVTPNSTAAAPVGVTVVADRRSAACVVAQLMSLPASHPVAWDTETTGVNPAKESPVHRGSVICATAYAGSSVDFGTGPRLFIDTLDGEPGLLDVFRPYFESPSCQKVWHHYAFDRHVLSNHNIHVSGFAGDTMHMARLHNSALPRYALAELCTRYLDNYEKVTMTDRFGKRDVLKSGAEGKSVIVPPTVTLQRGTESRLEWIDYSTADAELTHRLYNVLRNSLLVSCIAGTNSLPDLKKRYPNLLSLYEHIMLPFGQLLTDVERTGFRVDVDWLKKMENQAESDRVQLEKSFVEWAAKHSPDARYMNINSDQQKLQLFFAPCTKKGDKKEEIPQSKSFSIAMTGAVRDRYLEDLSKRTAPSDTERFEKYMTQIKPDKPLKVDISIKGLRKRSSITTAGGWPSVSSKALRKLAGWPRANPPVFGDPSDPEMCLAIDNLMEANSISTLSSTFLIPLQNWAGENNRIHASLNLNTETGRLSSRRPNLQNQPALEKDRYRIRKGFVCDEGNKLIVADYGQLELRLLAHITNCKSMIDAFKAGGDFHSRTALTMFDHVREAVDKGDCLLERDDNAGDDCPPLLKDMFSAERRKAKTLNFSIAYGKTVIGLARDWNVDEEEARRTLRLWYRDRPEISKWQYQCKELLHELGYVETILGRRRYLPFPNTDMRKRAHAERAAINAPLQGSAADLVMAAMVKLHNNPMLQVLGWKIILQVHDEVILEGPEESADVALPIVEQEMKNPIDINLNVDLTVDARCAKSWYDAK